MINIIDAIQSLRPGAIWTYHHGKEDFDEALIWLDETQSRPTKEELDAEVIRLQAEYDAKEYQRLRAPEYPPIGDQLDDLFHSGAFTQEMAAKIQAIKDKYPKGQ